MFLPAQDNVTCMYVLRVSDTNWITNKCSLGKTISSTLCRGPCEKNSKQLWNSWKMAYDLADTTVESQSGRAPRTMLPPDLMLLLSMVLLLALTVSTALRIYYGNS